MLRDGSEPRPGDDGQIWLFRVEAHLRAQTSAHLGGDAAALDGIQDLPIHLVRFICRVMVLLEIEGKLLLALIRLI